jgi:hypothetical protein
VWAAVSAHSLEAFFEQAHRVEAGAGGDVENGADVPCLQLVDEEPTFTQCTSLPVDQLVPLLDEAGDVLLRVVVGVAYLDRVVAEFLMAFSVDGFVLSRLAGTSVIRKGRVCFGG